MYKLNQYHTPTLSVVWIAAGQWLYLRPHKLEQHDFESDFCNIKKYIMLSYWNCFIV